MSSNQFELSVPPSDVISALTFVRNSPTKLLVSSWDRSVYLYDTHAQPGGQLLRKHEFRAPVLDIVAGEDENVAYTVGLDWDVRKLDLDTGEQTVLSTHTMASNRIAYSPNHHLLISASWDKTLHIHHPLTTPDQPATIELPAKPWALAVSPSKLVVSMHERHVYIYDLSALSLLSSQSAQSPPNIIAVDPFQRRESSLKWQTRAVACMPSDDGYATSSIEGRVAVEWFDASAESQARKYAFKCHRQPAGPEDEIDGQPTDIVHPVHALAFHPVHGTFVSGGGDGVVALWDAVAKRRIRQYQKYPCSVAAAAFSWDGKLMAVAASPQMESAKGTLGDGVVKVFIRELGEKETLGKTK